MDVLEVVVVKVLKDSMASSVFLVQVTVHLWHRALMQAQ